MKKYFVSIFIRLIAVYERGKSNDSRTLDMCSSSNIDRHVLWNDMFRACTTSVDKGLGSGAPCVHVE